MLISNVFGNTNSLQVSRIMKITGSVYESATPFLIYNSGDMTLDLIIKPINSGEITIPIQPGWFPVLCEKVNAGNNTIYIGQ